MAETTNTTQKAVTLESLEAASEYIATKAEVDAKIAAAVSSCANIAFASTEEVLALFQPKTQAPEEGT